MENAKLHQASSAAEQLQRGRDTEIQFGAMRILMTLAQAKSDLWEARADFEKPRQTHATCASPSGREIHGQKFSSPVCVTDTAFSFCKDASLLDPSIQLLKAMDDEAGLSRPVGASATMGISANPEHVPGVALMPISATMGISATPEQFSKDRLTAPLASGNALTDSTLTTASGCISESSLKTGSCTPCKARGGRSPLSAAAQVVVAPVAARLPVIIDQHAAVVHMAFEADPVCDPGRASGTLTGPIRFVAEKALPVAQAMGDAQRLDLAHAPASACQTAAASSMGGGHAGATAGGAAPTSGRGGAVRPGLHPTVRLKERAERRRLEREAGGIHSSDPGFHHLEGTMHVASLGHEAPASFHSGPAVATLHLRTPEADLVQREQVCFHPGSAIATQGLLPVSFHSPATGGGVWLGPWPRPARAHPVLAAASQADPVSVDRPDESADWLVRPDPGLDHEEGKGGRGISPPQQQGSVPVLACNGTATEPTGAERTRGPRSGGGRRAVRRVTNSPPPP